MRQEIDYDNDPVEIRALKRIANYCEDADLSPVYPKAILDIIREEYDQSR